MAFDLLCFLLLLLLCFAFVEMVNRERTCERGIHESPELREASAFEAFIALVHPGYEYCFALPLALGSLCFGLLPQEGRVRV